MQRRLTAILTDEEKRKELQYLAVFLFFGCFSAFMTVLNFITGKGTLIYVTGAFAILCGVNYLLARRGRKRGTAVASLLFGAEILSLFTYFLISGNPEGFSALWIALLPACGMLLFGQKRAAVLCALMFAVLVFLFWIPAGRSLLQYEYNPIFMVRFPILYAAVFLLSTLLETIRSVTQKELDKLREKYRYYAAHDYLTDLLNRQGLKEWHASFSHLEEQAVLMVDIDFFKQVNDSYGHDVGDLVLASVAQKIDSLADTRVCRWGGEEFIVWFADSGKMCDPEKLRAEIQRMEIRIPDTDKIVHVTVSIGVATGTGPLSTLVTHADEAMLRAKNGGRNRVVYH